MVETNGTPVIMGNDGFSGGCGFWGFLILAMFLFGGSGFGGFGNNNGNANAIQADVNRGFDNQNLQAQTRDILSAVTSGTAQSVGATNQTFHDMLTAFNDKYTELQRDIAGVSVAQAQALANQNECCCSQKMLIAETGAGINANLAQNRFDAAMNTAAINARTIHLSALNRIQDKLDGIEYIRILRPSCKHMIVKADHFRTPSQTSWLLRVPGTTVSPIDSPLNVSIIP